MVKELQDHLLMREIFWMKRIQNSRPPSDDLDIWANWDQLRDSSSLLFPRNCPCWRFPHSLGWARTLKKGESTNPPLPIALQKRIFGSRREGEFGTQIRGGGAYGWKFLSSFQKMTSDTLFWLFVSFISYIPSAQCVLHGVLEQMVCPTEPSPCLCSRAPTAQFCMWGAYICPLPSNKEFSLFQHCKSFHFI